MVEREDLHRVREHLHVAVAGVLPLQEQPDDRLKAAVQDEGLAHVLATLHVLQRRLVLQDVALQELLQDLEQVEQLVRVGGVEQLVPVSVLVDEQVAVHFLVDLPVPRDQ